MIRMMGNMEYTWTYHAAIIWRCTQYLSGYQMYTPKGISMASTWIPYSFPCGLHPTSMWIPYVCIVLFPDRKHMDSIRNSTWIASSIHVDTVCTSYVACTYIAPKVNLINMLRLPRQDEIIINRLRIGHTYLTYGHLLGGETPLSAWLVKWIWLLSMFGLIVFPLQMLGIMFSMLVWPPCLNYFLKVASRSIIDFILIMVDAIIVTIIALRSRHI